MLDQNDIFCIIMAPKVTYPEVLTAPKITEYNVINIATNYVQFKFTTTLDKTLIFFGAVAAMCGGAALPILMILKGIAVQVESLFDKLCPPVISVQSEVPFLRALLMMLVWKILEKQLTSPKMIEKKKCLQL